MQEYTLIFKTHTRNNLNIGVFESQEDYEVDNNIIWLPKSQIVLDVPEDELEKGEEYTIQVPEWLAVKVGLE